MQQFMAQYNMQCPMAAKRLIYSGLPATVEHGNASRHVKDSAASVFLTAVSHTAGPCRGNESNSAVAVAETVQHFITSMDSLKLNLVAIDQACAPLDSVCLKLTASKLILLPCRSTRYSATSCNQ